MKILAFLILSTCLTVCAHADRWTLDTISFTTNITSTVLDGRFGTPVKLTGILLSPPVSANECISYVKLIRPGVGYTMDVATVTYTNTAYRITSLDLILVKGQTLWISNTFSTGTAIIEFQME